MRPLDLSTDFEINFRGSYIHVLPAKNNEISPEGLLRVWNAIAAACQNYKCNKFLSEGNLHSRRLKDWDAFGSGTQASEIPGLRQASLFYNYTPDDLTEFFKTVTSNRGTLVEFFTDKAAALKWFGVTENN
jgi:hypothetical protein